MARNVGVGDILSSLVTLVSDARREVAIYTLILGGLTALGFVAGGSEPNVGELGVGFMVSSENSPLQALIDLVTSVAGIFAGYMLLRSYLRKKGRDRGEGRFWSYLGMSLLSGIGIAIGMIFLLVPGFFLAVRWSAAPGHVLGDNRSALEAMGASWESTKGHGWAILGAGLVTIVGLLVTLGIAAGILTSLSPYYGALAVSFLEPLLTAGMLGFAIAVYLLVSDGAQDLAETFA